MEEKKTEGDLNEYHPSNIFGNMNFTQIKLDWSKREYTLGGIIVVVVLIMLILAGFLGAKQPGSSSPTCSTNRCLLMSAYVDYTMDKSQNPCDNFYRYACGSYNKSRTLKPGRTSRTTLGDIYYKNQEKLRMLLEAPTSRTAEWASELKLKDLFSSCLDDFTIEKRQGRPFIEKILPKMGGWYVLNTWNQNAFDLNSNLKTVQTDFWVSAFWSNGVSFDWMDWSKNIVQLYPAGAGRYMYWSFYTRTDNQKIKNDYKKFMRRLANLIVRDSKLNLPADTSTRIEDFISDAFGMETKLAQLYMRTAVSRDRYQTSSRISLGELTKQTGGTIDWTQQMTYEFPNSLTSKSTVILYKKDFILGLTNLINNLDSATKNRMLHNYLVWRMLENYAQELSWEYVHANREYYVDIWGQAEFLGKWKYCFNYVNSVMPEAVGSLFVRDHFADKNRDKARSLTNYITKALEAEISDNQFLDSATKQIARAKLEKTVYKIGYPDFMLKPDQLDKIYKSLVINRTDFFQNVLNVNQFKKVYYDNKLAAGEDRTKWIYKTFDTTMAVLFYWNEIIVPAGFLSSPLYDYNNPQYMNFGSMGTVLGHFVTHMIDEQGMYWDGDGKYTATPWWTNGTLSSYAKVKECVVDFYNRTQGPFIAPNGKSEMIPIRSKFHAREAIAITTGVKLAFRAYRKWESDNGVESNPPVIGLTNDQMFFVAHAQTYCYNRNNNQAYTNAIRGRVEEDIRTNLALSQLPEFVKAFNCPAKSKMNADSKCGYY